MAIAAHFEESPQAAGKPRVPRRRLRLEARGATASGDPAEVLVHNLSATGLLLETAAALAIGERIAIELPHAGATEARVVWTSERLFGCEFDAPISAAALSAAQLRSPAGEDVDIDVPIDTRPDESFGGRLQRLRKERGLTQGRIAARIGVSKPTVWAWEHGKARPLDSRIAALAQALGVPPGDLMPGRDATGLHDLLVRSREQIARAVGTSPDKVRIMIEL
jgi:transcriptional regulator with XRE-family HTH domain